MKVVFPTCCGVDVHKSFLVATIIKTPKDSLQPSYQKKRFSTFYHNAVFVGKGKDGVAHHAHKRSTNSKGKSFRMTVESSDFRYAFNWPGTSGHLMVFEAPIDMLSFISLHHDSEWAKHSYVGEYASNSQAGEARALCHSPLKCELIVNISNFPL